MSCWNSYTFETKFEGLRRHRRRAGSLVRATDEKGFVTHLKSTTASSGPIVPNRSWPPQPNAFIESFNGRLRWIEVSSMPGTGASFAAWPATVLLETFDGSHLLSALTLQPRLGFEQQPIFELTQRRSSRSAGRIRRTTNVLCSFGAMVKFKTVGLIYGALRQANRRIKARTFLDGTQLGCGRGRVGSVDYRAKSDQMGMAGL
jgi:hypothetical protein